MTMPHAPSSRLDHLLHNSFQVSVLMKGAMATLEILAGALLWILGPRAVAFAQQVTLHRIGDPRNDWIAAHLRQFAESISLQSDHFYALYFISHGLVKLVLVIGLWHESRWAFPTSILAMSGFIVYQLYRYTQTGSVGLLVLSGFDLLVIALIWREYAQRRRQGLA